MADLAPKALPERREAVLAAAAECFMRRGYGATTMDHVAERLGATKGRVYHHYTSKPELFFAVYRRGMEIMREAVQPHLGARTAAGRRVPGGDRLVAMARAHTLCLMEARTFARTLILGVDLYRFGDTTPEHRAVLEELMAQRRDYELAFRRTVQAAVKDGSLSSRNPALATRTLLGALNGVTVWYEPRPGETRADREALAREVVQTVLQGLRCGQAAATTLAVGAARSAR